MSPDGGPIGGQSGVRDAAVRRALAGRCRATGVRGWCGSGGEVEGGVAGFGDGRRVGMLAEVGEKAPDLFTVANDGHEAKAAVALGALGDVDVVATAQEMGPRGGGAGHEQRAVEEPAQVLVAEDEGRAEAVVPGRP